MLKVYDKQEDIPEAFRGEYAKADDGKWYPEFDVRVHPGARGLKNSLDGEREEFRKYKAKFKDLPEDFDLEAYRQAMKDKEETERQRQLKAGEFDKREAEIIKNHNAAIAKLEAAAARRVAFIRKLVLENEARKALQDKALSVELQLPHMMAELEAVEDEATGIFAAIVVDPKGDRKSARVAGTQGGNMTIAQLAEEQLEREHFLANKKGAGGSGSGILHEAGRPGSKVVAGDDKSFSDNLVDIAAGKATVAVT